MRVVLPMLVALIGGCAASAAPQPSALSKVAVRAMPPEELTQRLFGELSQMMMLVPENSQSVRPTRPLTNLLFVTVPRASGEPGICVTEEVRVDFEPIREAADARTPVRPVGLSTSERLLVRESPTAAILEDEDDAETLRREQSACAAIDPRSAMRISAPSAFVLQEMMRHLRTLESQVRAGRLTASLDCSAMTAHGDPPMTDAACLAEIGRTRLDLPYSVSYCEPERTMRCLEAAFATLNLRFEFAPAFDPPVKIVVEPMVVVADRRID